MIKPSIPSNEESRLKELSLLEILDTDPEAEYDEITELASAICEAPVSLVSLIDKDRQWFKSVHGTAAGETPRYYSFCAHAINSSTQIFEVCDAKFDERFHDNPMVVNEPYVKFYAGVPLVSSQGNALGTLCVIDMKPKVLNTLQKNALKTLARQVVKSLELRKKNIQTQRQNELLKDKNNFLGELARVISHDLKSPLNNIIGLSEILSNSNPSNFDITSKLAGLISQTANNLKELIYDVITYSTSEGMVDEPKETVSLDKIVEECKLYYSHLSDITFKIDLKCETVVGNSSVWKQIIFNLVSNAVQYNDKDRVSVAISSFSSKEERLIHFVVEDNGTGIPEDMRQEVFKPFMTLKAKTRNGEKSSGLGLATVNKLVGSLNGTIDIEANEPHGSKFNVNVPFAN